eukprot:4691142-Amphidinium_carterae.1
MDLYPKEREVTYQIQGVGGQPVHVQKMITWPIGIRGHCGEIQSLELPCSEVPLLLSRQAQEALGFVIRTRE